MTIIDMATANENAVLLEDYDLFEVWMTLNEMWNVLYKRADKSDDENLKLRKALTAGCIAVSTIQALLEEGE